MKRTPEIERLIREIDMAHKEGVETMRKQILEWAERKKKVGAYWHWDEFIEWLKALKVPE